MTTSMVKERVSPKNASKSSHSLILVSKNLSFHLLHHVERRNWHGLLLILIEETLLCLLYILVRVRLSILILRVIYWFRLNWEIGLIFWLLGILGCWGWSLSLSEGRLLGLLILIPILSIGLAHVEKVEHFFEERWFLLRLLKPRILLERLLIFNGFAFTVITSKKASEKARSISLLFRLLMSRLMTLEGVKGIFRCAASANLFARIVRVGSTDDRRRAAERFEEGFGRTATSAVIIKFNFFWLSFLHLLLLLFLGLLPEEHLLVFFACHVFFIRNLLFLFL